MAYEDEKIIKAMNAYKKGTYGSIQEGFFIKEELVTFEKEWLFDKKMQIQRVLRLALTRRIKSSVKLFASCRESVVIVIAEFRSGKRGLKFMLQKRGEVCCGFGDYGLFLEQFLHHGLNGEDSFASCDPFGCHYRAKCETVAAFCAVGD